MIEFNLEAAKAGVPLVTRDGHKLRIICFDRIDEKRHGNIVALMLGKSKKYEMFISYDLEGHNIGSYDSNLDIMIDNGK